MSQDSPICPKLLVLTMQKLLLITVAIIHKEHPYGTRAKFIYKHEILVSLIN